MSNYCNCFVFLDMQRALLTSHVVHTHSYFDWLKSSYFSFASPLKPPEKKNLHTRRLLQKEEKKLVLLN
jgi:hypothetical protein